LISISIRQLPKCDDELPKIQVTKTQQENKNMPQATARRPIRIAFWSLLLVTLAVRPLLAQAPPSADTFVSSSTPKTNYGPAIALVVCQGSTSYVQFNLAGIPAGANISKATLRLYVDAVAKAVKATLNATISNE
jgi:hypothetical protein